MARKKVNSSSGRTDRVIHSSWRGRPYTRAYPETVSNPNTKAQQAHRNAFVALSRLASYMKEGHQIGLQYQAVRMNLNTFCAFKKLNSGLVKADRIDYQHLYLSKGPVSGVRVTGVRIEEQHLKLTFIDRYMTQDEADDNFYLYAYCENLCEGELYGPVFRRDGTIDAIIPTEWNGLKIHLYCYLIDAKSRSSDTIYAILDEWNI